MNKLNYKMAEVTCNFCKTEKGRPYITGIKEEYNNSGEQFNLVKCPTCGLVFTNPRPTKETIRVFYPDNAAYYQPQEIYPVFDQRNTFKQRVFKSILRNHYGYPTIGGIPFFVTWPLLFFFRNYLDLLHLPKYVPQGRLLDIGCSWGGYLLRMRELGWQVYGVDLNEAAVNHARSKLGMDKVVLGFAEEALFEDSFFDVVHMSMCLEHMYDPVQTLKQINSLLKENGQLIISVPDITGFEVLLYGKKAYTMHVPQHLFHFSPKTIRKVLKVADFYVERIVHQNYDRDLVSPSKYLHNKLIRKSLVKIFVTFLSWIGKTSRMSIYARKQA